ncbi:MAG: helix-turn-helix domain-containing protein [Acidobacteria bacterium]|nr:helix-turn-helix domain-containing protein [Acidobacteriota bacterium]
MTPTDLKRIRRQLGLTQEELARRLGVHAVTVARWEADMRGIPEPTARLIRMIRAEVKGRAKGKRRQGREG